MTYQIVIISISHERKTFMEKQLEKLNIKNNIRIHYIRPATPENSKHYLPTNSTKTSVICCALSHLYCLEYACLSSSPEFTVIIEDDAVFHKTQFVNCIEEIIERWDNIIYPRKIASLGWVPVENPEWYDKLRISHSLRCLNGTGITYIFNPGLQCYIVRKKDIKPLLSTILYSTYEELDKYIENYKKNNNDTYINSYAVDYFLPTLLGQAVVFPPVVIENSFHSTLQHDNWKLYWNAFFKGKEKRLDDYF